MSAYQSARSSSSSGSLAENEPVIRSACMAFEEAVASRLAECYSTAEIFKGDHGSVATSAIDLTAGVMLAIAKLGETLGTSERSVDDFVNAVADVVLSEHTSKIVLYDPETEITKTFDEKDEPAVEQLRMNFLKKMEKTDAAAHDERKLQEAKELVKKLEAEYQAKMEDLVNIAKYGTTLRKKTDQDKITPADVQLFRKQLEKIYDSKHAPVLHAPAAEGSQSQLKSRRSIFFFSAGEQDSPISPGAPAKKIQSPSDGDSTGSQSPKISCCAALFGKRKVKRRTIF